MVTGVCRLHKWSFVRIHDLLSKIRMCDQVQEGQLQQYFSKSRFLEILWQFRGESDHYMLRGERRLVEIGLLWRSGIGVGLKGSVGFREKKYRENGTAIWQDYAGSLKEVFVELPCVLRIFPGRAVVKNLHANAGDVRDAGLIPQSGRSSAHSNILAWRIPWTEEPDGLQSMGSHRIGRDWSNWAHTYHMFSECGDCWKWKGRGTSLVVQWLKIRLTVQDMWVQSPGRGIKIPHAMGQVSLQATTKTQCSQINKYFLEKERASLIAQLVKNPPAMQETMVQFLSWEGPLEKG